MTLARRSSISFGVDHQMRQQGYRAFLGVKEPYRQIVDEALLKQS